MLSPRFYLILIALMLIIPAYSINYAGTLTPSECKAYFASDDINKNLQAYFSCPKRMRIPKKRIARLDKHSLLNNDDDEDYNYKK